MRLSIALCTFNGACFLPEQLRSLLQQRRLPDQVVVCDDCSSDGTSALLRAFVVEAESLGIQVDLHFNSENLGYVRNFEKALASCDGDVVFLKIQQGIGIMDQYVGIEGVQSWRGRADTSVIFHSRSPFHWGQTTQHRSSVAPQTERRTPTQGGGPVQAEHAG